MSLGGGAFSLEKRHRDSFCLLDNNRTAIFFCTATNVSDEREQSQAVRTETGSLGTPVRAHWGGPSPSSQDIPEQPPQGEDITRCHLIN